MPFVWLKAEAAADFCAFVDLGLARTLPALLAADLPVVFLWATMNSNLDSPVAR